MSSACAALDASAIFSISGVIANTAEANRSTFSAASAVVVVENFRNSRSVSVEAPPSFSTAAAAICACWTILTPDSASLVD